MAVWSRGRAGVTDLAGLIHHTDAGSRYVSLALTERLAALGMRASIGTVGDDVTTPWPSPPSGRYETELIRRRGPWRTLDDVEIATLEWVDWCNDRRLHSEPGDVPPAEHEANHYRPVAAPHAREAAEPSLH